MGVGVSSLHCALIGFHLIFLHFLKPSLASPCLGTKWPVSIVEAQHHETLQDAKVPRQKQAQLTDVCRAVDAPQRVPVSKGTAPLRQKMT